MRDSQHTIGAPVEFTSVGLHTGQTCTARVLPAPPDSGVTFRRTDVRVDIPAAVGNVAETSFATVLALRGARVSTVEHFLAALYGMEIDNAVIEVDGPELPILDGSCLPVAKAIASAGCRDQAVRRRFLHVLEGERIRRNGSMLAASPSDELEILMVVDFRAAAIGKQWIKFTLSPEAFLAGVAPARTFVLKEQIEGLWAAGLAKGGSLENAIVVDGEEVLNAGGLRFPDEFVRHKLLDFIGDIALVGRPVRGSFLAVRPGHTINRSLTEYLSGLGSAFDERPPLFRHGPEAALPLHG